MSRFAIAYPHEAHAHRPDHEPDRAPLYLQQKGRYYGGNDSRNRGQHWTESVEEALTWAKRESAERESAERNLPTIVNSRGEDFPARVVEVADA